jgi:hypothetical protein
MRLDCANRCNKRLCGEYPKWATQTRIAPVWCAIRLGYYKVVVVILPATRAGKRLLPFLQFKPAHEVRQSNVGNGQYAVV